jgi:hypothetical protein
MRFSKRNAQQEHLENVGTPKVTIEPYNSMVQEAIKLVESKNPEALKSISDINLNLSGEIFGEYTNKTPHTVNINIRKIEDSIRKNNPNISDEEFKNLMIKEIASTYVHEYGHMKAYTERKDTSEIPAEQAEEEFKRKL